VTLGGLIQGIYDTTRAPYLSPTEIAEIRRKKLREIVRHAYRTVPYYHETFTHLGLAPDDIQTEEDLQRLPIISKIDVHRNPLSFISREFDISECIRFRTSGTSGMPVTIYYDENALMFYLLLNHRWNRIIAASAGLPFLGVRRADIAVLNTSSHILQLFYEDKLKFSKLFQEVRFFSVFNSPETNLEAIKKFRPHRLHSYSSAVEILTLHIIENGGDWPDSVKVCTFFADSLRPKVRQIIEEEFGCTVFGHYAAIEAFGIGYECDGHCGYHLNTDAYIIDLVHGNRYRTRKGDRGEVVISNLNNRAMVLLNYRLGDIGVWGDDCGCGCNLPLLREIEGRVDDIIVLPDGRMLPPAALHALYDEQEYIDQYQFTQESEDNFLTKVVSNKNRTPTSDEKLITGLKQILGKNASIKIEHVDKITITRTGKYRRITSHVKRQTI
jgi:phenylacetate-CoA ligase